MFSEFADIWTNNFWWTNLISSNFSHIMTCFVNSRKFNLIYIIIFLKKHRSNRLVFDCILWLYYRRHVLFTADWTFPCGLYTWSFSHLIMHANSWVSLHRGVYTYWPHGVVTYWERGSALAERDLEQPLCIKHRTLTQYWVNAGPSSQTTCQH